MRCGRNLPKSSASNVVGRTLKLCMVPSIKKFSSHGEADAFVEQYGLVHTYVPVVDTWANERIEVRGPESPRRATSVMRIGGRVYITGRIHRCNCPRINPVQPVRPRILICKSISPIAILVGSDLCRRPWGVIRSNNRKRGAFLHHGDYVHVPATYDPIETGILI